MNISESSSAEIMLPYSSDLFREFFMFGPQKKLLKGRQFNLDTEIEFANIHKNFISRESIDKYNIWDLNANGKFS